MNLWHQFEGVRLFDIESILTKGASFELRTFKNMMLQKFEKNHEKLMNGYVRRHSLRFAR